MVDVFRVLRDKTMAAELHRRLVLTPFARAEFEAISEATLNAETDIVERARLTLIRSFMGHGSESTRADSKTGFRSNSNRSNTTPAHDWANWPSVIPAFVDRLKGVVIENANAVDVMRRHDSPQTLHYVDPPYIHSTRGTRMSYAFEMSDDDHRALALALRDLKGMVVLSGYGCRLYDETFHDWSRVETEALADGARKRTEVLWLSPATSKALAECNASPMFF